MTSTGAGFGVGEGDAVGLGSSVGDGVGCIVSAIDDALAGAEVEESTPQPATASAKSRMLHRII